MNVFIGHAYIHLQVDIPFLGGLIQKFFQGVPIFFGLSGFLIWNSISNTKNFKEFCKKRIFRLYPELLMGVLLNSIVIICLFNKNIKWIQFILFNITQSTVFQFWTPSFLRGYGCGTPNGSLWTIGVMVQCYIILWILYKFLHNSNFNRWIVLFLIFISFNIINQYKLEFLPEIINKLFGQTFFPYIWLFILGGFISEYFDYFIENLKKYWLLLFAFASFINITNFDFGTYGTIWSIFFIFSVIGFGYKYHRLNIKLDLSYGIYLYHMVIINVLIELGYTNKIIYAIVAFFISIVLACISYYSIGNMSRNLREYKIERNIVNGH